MRPPRANIDLKCVTHGQKNNKESKHTTKSCLKLEKVSDRRFQ